MVPCCHKLSGACFKPLRFTKSCQKSYVVGLKDKELFFLNLEIGKCINSRRWRLYLMQSEIPPTVTGNSRPGNSAAASMAVAPSALARTQRSGASRARLGSKVHAPPKCRIAHAYLDRLHQVVVCTLAWQKVRLPLPAQWGRIISWNFPLSINSQWVNDCF